MIETRGGARAFPASARALLERATAWLADASLARRRQASVECPREADVFEAVAFGHWPDHCADLVVHVSSCEVCAELVEIAGALHDDRESLCREAPLPAAGMVWWRATIRARADAARTATQPISVLQGIAGACIVGAAAGLVSVAWQSIHWVDRLADLAVRLESRRADIASASTLAAEHGLPILLALAAGLVLAPLALYITLADD
jgi:hypothetical protein